MRTDLLCHTRQPTSLWCWKMFKCYRNADLFFAAAPEQIPRLFFTSSLSTVLELCYWQYVFIEHDRTFNTVRCILRYDTSMPSLVTISFTPTELFAFHLNWTVTMVSGAEGVSATLSQQSGSHLRTHFLSSNHSHANMRHRDNSGDYWHNSWPPRPCYLVLSINQLVTQYLSSVVGKQDMSWTGWSVCPCVSPLSVSTQHCHNQPRSAYILSCIPLLCTDLIRFYILPWPG